MSQEVHQKEVKPNTEKCNCTKQIAELKLQIAQLKAEIGILRLVIGGRK